MATVVSGLIEKHGGAQGIVAQMEQQGLGKTVKSWVSTRTHLPISPDQVHAAFGQTCSRDLRLKSAWTRAISRKSLR